MWDVSATPSGIKREWYVCMYNILRHKYLHIIHKNTQTQHKKTCLCTTLRGIEPAISLRSRLVYGQQHVTLYTSSSILALKPLKWKLYKVQNVIVWCAVDFPAHYVKSVAISHSCSNIWELSNVKSERSDRRYILFLTQNKRNYLEPFKFESSLRCLGNVTLRDPTKRIPFKIKAFATFFGQEGRLY
jgi:hypothetical protein